MKIIKINYFISYQQINYLKFNKIFFLGKKSNTQSVIGNDPNKDILEYCQWEEEQAERERQTEEESYLEIDTKCSNTQSNNL